jgi:hypothetical protein
MREHRQAKGAPIGRLFGRQARAAWE